MKSNKRIVCLILVFSLLAGVLSACSTSEEGQASQVEHDSKYADLVKVDYDAINEALPQLTEEEMKKVVEVGYRDCDHMIAGPIGDAAGIYDNLGIKYNLTQTGQVYEAMAAGKMDCAYMGVTSLIRSIYKGAPICISSGNHTGGSWYLVARNDIDDPTELIGGKLAIGGSAEMSPGWHSVSSQVGIPAEASNYEVFEMSDRDEYFAFTAGQLDAFTCCDPWGSYAEYEGIGTMLATDWGASKGMAEGKDAGICCVFGFNTDFIEKYPNLTTRLMYAHILSVQYMYLHPYRAAEIFADAFDIPVEVALRTIWVKATQEGRTITWEMYPENYAVFLEQYEKYNIPEDARPPLELDNLDKVWNRKQMEEAMAVGAEKFEDFIKEKVDPIFPLGISFEEFLEVAKEIEGITDQGETDDTN